MSLSWLAAALAGAQPASTPQPEAAAPAAFTLSALEPAAVVHDPVVAWFREAEPPVRLHLDLEASAGAPPAIGPGAGVGISLMRSVGEDVPRHTATPARLVTEGCSTLPSRICVELDPPARPGRYSGEVQLQPSTVALTARAPFSLMVRLPWWIAFLLAVAGASVSVLLVGVLDDQRRTAEQLRVLAQLQRDVALARSERFVAWMTSELRALPGRRLGMDAFRREVEALQQRLVRFGQLEAALAWRTGLSGVLADRVARDDLEDRLAALEERLHTALHQLDDEDAFAQLLGAAQALRDDAARAVTADVMERFRALVPRAEGMARRLRRAVARVEAMPGEPWAEAWLEDAVEVQDRLSASMGVPEPQGETLRGILAAAQQSYERRVDELAAVDAAIFELLGQLARAEAPTLESARAGFGVPPSPDMGMRALPGWPPRLQSGEPSSFQWSGRSLASAAQVARGRLSALELVVQGVLVITLGLAYLLVFYFPDPSWGSGPDLIGALFFGLGLQFTAATPAAELYKSIAARFGDEPEEPGSEPASTPPEG